MPTNRSEQGEDPWRRAFRYYQVHAAINVVFVSLELASVAGILKLPNPDLELTEIAILVPLFVALTLLVLLLNMLGAGVSLVAVLLGPLFCSGRQWGIELWSLFALACGGSYAAYMIPIAAPEWVAMILVPYLLQYGVARWGVSVIDKHQRLVQRRDARVSRASDSAEH